MALSSLLEYIGLFVLAYFPSSIILQWFFDCDFWLAYKERFGKRIDTLCHKVIWITGASSGIGEHLAYHLARAGCKLILSARREVELIRVKAKCLQENKSLNNDDVEVLVLDILDIEKHDEAFQRVIDKFGKLDILVNNAGRSQRALWTDIDLDVDRQIFELNVFSILSLSRIVLKYFLEKGGGHLAVTSSLAGVAGVPFSASYTGSKHALHGYFDSLHVEMLGKNIKTTLFCPGPIQTPFLEESFTAVKGEKFGQKTPIDSNKLSADRCGQLYGVALANEIHETWVSSPKPRLLAYLNRYYPSTFKKIIGYVGAKYILRLRDAKQTLETNSG